MRFIMGILLVLIVSTVGVSASIGKSDIAEARWTHHCMFEKDIYCTNIIFWSNGTLEFELTPSTDITIQSMYAEIRMIDADMGGISFETNCSDSNTYILKTQVKNRISLQQCTPSPFDNRSKMFVDIQFYFNYSDNTSNKTTEGGGWTEVVQAGSMSADDVIAVRTAEEVERRKQVEKRQTISMLTLFGPIVLYILLLIATAAFIKLRKINKLFFLSWGISIAMTLLFIGMSVVFALLLPSIELVWLILTFAALVGVPLGYHAMRTYINYLHDKAGWLPTLFYFFNMLVLFSIFIFLSRAIVNY